MTISKRDIYIEDDWKDNKLTNRDNVSEGYFLHPSDNLLGGSSQDPGAYASTGDVEAGNALKGIYRPEWSEISGNVEVKNNSIVVGGTSDDDFAATSSHFSTGIWTFDYTWQSTKDTYSLTLGILQNKTDLEGTANPRGGYVIWIDGSTSYNLVYTPDSNNWDVIISGSWDYDTNQRTSKTTRDRYGRWELFYEGNSQGTTVDTRSSEAGYINIVSQGEDEKHVNSIDVK